MKYKIENDDYQEDNMYWLGEVADMEGEDKQKLVDMEEEGMQLEEGMVMVDRKMNVKDREMKQGKQ